MPLVATTSYCSATARSRAANCKVSEYSVPLCTFCLRNFGNVETLLYITIARFSNSCWRTGMAQPAISTRPAASSAAVGETP